MLGSFRNYVLVAMVNFTKKYQKFSVFLLMTDPLIWATFLKIFGDQKPLTDNPAIITSRSSSIFLLDNKFSKLISQSDFPNKKMEKNLELKTHEWLIMKF
jgi:hypothetical protein